MNTNPNDVAYVLPANKHEGTNWNILALIDMLLQKIFQPIVRRYRADKKDNRWMGKVRIPDLEWCQSTSQDNGVKNFMKSNLKFYSQEFQKMDWK